MAPLPIARVVIFLLIIAFITGLAFYSLTVARHCPPERPLRVEDGSCVPTTFFEGTVIQRTGQK